LEHEVSAEQTAAHRAKERKGADLSLMGLSHEQRLVKMLMGKLCRLHN